MLVLSRRIGERVKVVFKNGETALVYLLKTSKGRAQLGFEGGEGIRFEREEARNSSPREVPHETALSKSA